MNHYVYLLIWLCGALLLGGALFNNPDKSFAQGIFFLVVNFIFMLLGALAVFIYWKVTGKG